MERIKTIAPRVLLVLTALLWALNSVGEAATTKLTCSAKETSKASQAQVIAQLQPPASISRPPVVLPTVAEMPKYKVGDSWTVRFADGRTSRRIVRAIEKDQYVFEWGSDLWRYYDQNLVLRKQVTPEDGKEVRTSLLTRQTIEFPLATNKTWGFRYRLVVTQAGGVPSGTGVWREFSFKVLGAETINTPAGPFGTFKVEETSNESQCLGGVCRTPDDTLTVRHLWYAPETKFIVKVAGVTGRYISEQEPDYELIAFDLK